ncbi:lipoprotein, putative [Bacillus cereus biovar anthracis str. CI]|nr:lipoprotein, putative [Bacillus cereus biovar anthracis str. CI]
MKVTYQDNSIQEFFVWIEPDGDIVIAKASDETHVEGYDLREDNSKKIFQFFEKEF